MEVGVFVVAGFVFRADLDRVRVRGRAVGLRVARLRDRGPGVVAGGDVGAAGDVEGEGDGHRATALGCRDVGAAGAGEGGVAGARRVVDDRPEGVRRDLRGGDRAELVGVYLEPGQGLLLQLAGADRLLLDRVAVDLLRRVGGAREGD